MSFVTARNGLVATIQAYGKFSASQISTCDFGIVELAASTVVIFPGPNTTITPLTFQSTASTRTKEVTYDIQGVVFVKDPGDPKAWLANLWTASDDIFNSVNLDDSLNGQIQAAHVTTRGRPDPDTFYRLNDIDYAGIRFSVRAVEWI